MEKEFKQLTEEDVLLFKERQKEVEDDKFYFMDILGHREDTGFEMELVKTTLVDMDEALPDLLIRNYETDESIFPTLITQKTLQEISN